MRKEYKSSEYHIDDGKYSLHRYCEIKEGRKWIKHTDEMFEEQFKIVDEQYVNNVINGENPFSSKERRTWNSSKCCGNVYSYSPDGTKRHVWEFKYIGRF